MNEIRAITTFIRAAALGSLRKAAIDQGISPQAASQAVMQLENSLGIRLFHRTTRKLSLTQEGQRFLDSVKPGIELVTGAYAAARRSTEIIEGPLKVSAPRALGLSLFHTYFMAFCDAYPEVQLDVQLEDRFTDLVGDRADVGFRGGALPSEGAIARHLLPIQMIVCAAPSYIERHGAPASIEELALHSCTGYRTANTGKIAPWEFRVNDELVYQDVTPRFCTNDIEGEAQAVLDGLGIGQLGSFTAAEPIRSGRLIPLLVQHVTDHEGIYMYYGQRTELPLRVRTFIDFMVKHLAGNRRFFLEPAELRALALPRDGNALLLMKNTRDNV
ncbi:LysR family transcriptional regulator [Sodalis ligni]|jgi:DNA-binding transcriptional LysR family regulator|uniref:DNA-binding transcriptional LysR family regulator n=1 Tax=Sodalis ligni TaxID=2697027 RepID=A0A4R1NGX2_9GAMM|nr:LysR family transcriptional regulator [Sodalis ligni]TCL05051.1 DNA-binding transcriptional LysR family regulator [Sodalis ligni]